MNERIRFGAVILIALAVLAACKEPPPATDEERANASTPALDSDDQRNAYALGVNLGQQMNESGMRLDSDSFLAGIRDVLEGKEPRIDGEEVETRVRGVQEQERFRRQEELAAVNRAEAEAFFAANATTDGVETTASGLQYQVIEPGDGDRPSETDIVTVHYRGTLLDGTEFDSSFARDQPATFPLNRVIKGWTEALQLMPVGSKYKLFIPADLAYGKRGNGRLIGPDAALIFEVELLGVEPADSDK